MSYKFNPFTGKLDDTGNDIAKTPTGTVSNTITIPNATYNGLIIKGYTGQSADPLQWADINGAVLGRVTSDGDIKLGSTTRNGQLILSGATSTYGDVKMYADVNGGALVVEADKVTNTAKMRILPLGNDIYYQISNASNTGGIYFTGNGGLDTNGLIKFAVNTLGTVVFGSTLATSDGMVTIYGNTNRKQFVVRAGTGQTAANQIIDIQDASGNSLFGVDKDGVTQGLYNIRASAGAYGATTYFDMSSSGFVKYTGGTYLGGLQQGTTRGGSAALVIGGASGRPIQIGYDGLNSLETGVEVRGGILTTSASAVPVFIKGAVAQTANLTEWQNSSGTNLSQVSKDGYFRIGSSGAPLYALHVENAQDNQVLIATSGSGNQAGFFMYANRGFTGYGGQFYGGSALGTSFFGNLWKDTYIIIADGATNAGMLIGTLSSGYLVLGTNNQERIKILGTGQTTLTSGGASVIPFIIKGATSQSSDLQEWRNSSDTVMSYIRSDGTLSSPRGTSGGVRNFFLDGAGNATVSGNGGNYGIGDGTLTALTTGYFNVAIGSLCMASAANANSNFALGNETLRRITSGAGNVAVGVAAGDKLTTGINNILLGSSAGRGIVGGNSNTVIGAAAFNSGTGSENVAIGQQALYAVVGGNYNTVVGTYAGLESTGGTGNTFLGYLAGQKNSSNYNVFLGYSAGANETGANKLYIANSNTSTPLIYGLFTGTGAGVTIHSQAADGVPLVVKGTTSQASDLQQWKNSSSAVLSCVDNNGWLGVGSTDPTNLLTVYGTNTTTGTFYNTAIVDSSTSNGTYATKNYLAVGNPSATNYYSYAMFNYIYASAYTNAGTNLVAINNQIDFQSNGTAVASNLFANWSYITLSGANAYTMTAVYGNRVELTNNSAVNVTSAFGNWTKLSLTEAGNITNAYGAYIDTTVESGAGAITNLYGIYVANQNVGATLNYGAYLLGGKTATIYAETGTTTAIGQIIKGASSQTANLTEWQNSSSSILALVDANGGAVFNETGSASADFRVESDTEANMIYLDANGDTDGALYLGGNTNGIKIGKGGELTLIGTATRFDDLRVEPVARSTGANVPSFEKWFDDAGGTSRGVYLYSFDDVVTLSEKEIHFTAQLPHSWKEGSTIYIHVHWVGNTSDTTATPAWGLEYVWKDIGQVFGDTTIVYTTSGNIDGDGTPDPDITAGKHYISAFDGIAPDSTQNNLSSILIGRIFRRSGDASDTYDVAGNKCGLLYIDIHYEIDSMGSREEYVK